MRYLCKPRTGTPPNSSAGSGLGANNVLGIRPISTEVSPQLPCQTNASTDSFPPLIFYFVRSPFSLETSSAFTGDMAFPVPKNALIFSKASRYARCHATSVNPPMCGWIMTLSLSIK